MQVIRPECPKRILHRRERRAHCRLRAQNIRPQRDLHESASRRGSEFRVGPSSLGADGDSHASGIVVVSHASATGSRTSRNGLAPARSESNQFEWRGPTPETRRAVSRRPSAPGCANAAPAARIRRGFASIVRRASLPRRPGPFRFGPPRAATISSAPSSVAFSSAHSNRSNFTMARSNSIRTAAIGTGSCSTSENWTSSRPTLSVRASHTLCPSLSSYNCPVSARSTRPRWCAASPRRVADPASNSSTKNRLRMCRYVISIGWHRAPSRPAPRCPRPFPHFSWRFLRSLSAATSNLSTDAATALAAPPRRDC